MSLDHCFWQRQGLGDEVPSRGLVDSQCIQSSLLVDFLSLRCMRRLQKRLCLRLVAKAYEKELREKIFASCRHTRQNSEYRKCPIPSYTIYSAVQTPLMRILISTAEKKALEGVCKT